MRRVSIKAFGIEELLVELKHAGVRVSDSARKTMHRTADQIVKEAKILAPVDTHALEKSIRKEVTYGERGRLQIQIVMGGVVDGINVDEYAVRIHETYDREHMGLSTQIKQTFYPEHLIGEKFLTRAAEKFAPKLREKMIETVQKEWRL